MRVCGWTVDRAVSGEGVGLSLSGLGLGLGLMSYAAQVIS